MRIASLRAVAVTALALPLRNATRRYNAPRAVWVRPRFMAASRRMAATRLADGWVRLLRRRPPDTLLWGARVSQDVKCFSVGQRVISVPISESRRSAL